MEMVTRVLVSCYLVDLGLAGMCLSPVAWSATSLTPSFYRCHPLFFQPLSVRLPVAMSSAGQRGLGLGFNLSTVLSCEQNSIELFIYLQIECRERLFIISKKYVVVVSLLNGRSIYKTLPNIVLLRGHSRQFRHQILQDIYGDNCSLNVWEVLRW